MSEVLPRVYGSEVEYGYTGALSPDAGLPPHHTLYPPKMPHFSDFLPNGARMYIDVGLPEYATPECIGLDELVAHELAGEELIWEAYSQHPDIYTLHKRSISTRGRATTGSHENYGTYSDILKGRGRINALATHFATRTIFAGAGYLHDGKMRIGQKVQHIRAEYGEEPTSNKALVNSRNEPHGASPNARLHVVCGDANISPWALRMKFGTTSLVLRLLENQIDLEEIALESPVEAAQMVGRGYPNMLNGLRLKTGNYLTALDIQEVLAGKTQDLSKAIELPEDELQVLADWHKVIAALRKYTTSNEPSSILKQIDWYTKLELVQAYARKNAYPSIHTIQALDLHYDQTSGALVRKLRGGRFKEYTPSFVSIEEAKHSPPNGRAQKRGAIVLRAYTKKMLDDIIMDWSSIAFLNEDKVIFKKVELGPIRSKYDKQAVAQWISNLDLV